MEVISTIRALDERLADAGQISFVPTMGNLHEGHLELVRLARAHGDTVVVSIFVNPLQFGPREDFHKYPRTLAEDCAKLESVGCDVVFAPTVSEMYPTPEQTEILPPPLADELCGAFRPGHFRGVATVVAKLFNIVQPTVAVFGKKDYQQLVIIRMMVRDLNFPVRILAGETVRAADGLALSSRNAYLTPVERAEAPRLFRVLAAAARAIEGGERDFEAVAGQARRELESNGWRVDYVAVRTAGTLAAPTTEGGPWVVLGAAWLGETRLIDNVETGVEGASGGQTEPV
jgi:pantoate--beta-alanine ligase